MIGFENLTLRSERLTYRLLNDSDKDALFRILHEPETTVPAGFVTITDREVFDDFFSSLTQYNTGIAILLNGGCIGFYHVNKYIPETEEHKVQTNIGIGFLIGKNYQQNGFGTETLLTLDKYLLTKFDNIWGDYFEENAASKRVLEKCGFKFVRTYEAQFDNLNGERKTLVSNVLSG